MGNYFSPFSLRISEALIEKIKFIAHENKRSANKEIEFALEKYIQNYEELNGYIQSDTFHRIIQKDFNREG